VIDLPQILLFWLQKTRGLEFARSHGGLSPKWQLRMATGPQMMALGLLTAAAKKFAQTPATVLIRARFTVLYLYSSEKETSRSTETLARSCMKLLCSSSDVNHLRTRPHKFDIQLEVQIRGSGVK
jgi:hypothetical protein